MLNLIKEKISLDGKNFICVPETFDLPLTFSGYFASPFSNSIKYFSVQKMFLTRNLMGTSGAHSLKNQYWTNR